MCPHIGAPITPVPIQPIFVVLSIIFAVLTCKRSGYKHGHFATIRAHEKLQT
jgi:hypothetical protein